LEQRKSAIIALSAQLKAEHMPIDPPFELKQRIIKLVVDEIVLNVPEGSLELTGSISGA
jgi:hypothetical protein